MYIFCKILNDVSLISFLIFLGIRLDADRNTLNNIDSQRSSAQTISVIVIYSLTSVLTVLGGYIRRIL